jgi:hypothetical protein
MGSAEWRKSAHCAHKTAVRIVPNDVSSLVVIAPSIGAQKLGQPVPLSNLVFEENSGRSQPAQANSEEVP